MNKRPSRIRALPERVWDANVDELIELLTEELRTPQGTRRLRPAQAASIYELLQQPGWRGAFLGLPVGEGKTALAGLVCEALECDSPVIVTTGGLVDSTRRQLAKDALHWRIPLEKIRVLSYSWLALREQSDYFDRCPGDLWIFDEFHKLKRVGREGKPGSSVPRRLARSLSANPNRRIVVMSGSIAEDGLEDYAHCLDWTLRDGAPIPRSPARQKALIKALRNDLDEGKKPDLDVFKDDYGPCATYVDLTRNYSRRLNATPGVIISHNAFTDAQINILPVEYELQSDKVLAGFDDLRKLKIAPDGWDLAEGAMGGEAWMTACRLSAGYYPKHVPWPPQDWFDARRAYFKLVRGILENSSSYDTEYQVREALQLGHMRAVEYDDWVAIEPTFKVHRENEWLSGEVVEFVAEWIAQHERRTGRPLCTWVQYPEFGRALSRYTRIPFFHNGGLDSADRYIEDVQGNVIASIKANATGRNLQYNWADALVIGWPTTTTEAEQMIGRHARNGQTAREVNFHYLASCREHLRALDSSLERARGVQDREGMPQALCRAHVEYASGGFGPQWN